MLFLDYKFQAVYLMYLGLYLTYIRAAEQTLGTEKEVSLKKIPGYKLEGYEVGLTLLMLTIISQTVLIFNSLFQAQGH